MLRALLAAFGSRGPIRRAIRFQGTLDPYTRSGEIVRPHYSGSNQYFVSLPNGVHVAIAGSWGCGLQVMMNFLREPSSAPDTSCIADMPPLDFGTPPGWWLAEVGIQDLWENP
jgi:hypothetical protein